MRPLRIDEIEKALGADNMWFAGLALGREPTPIEAVRHYISRTRFQPQLRMFTVIGGKEDDHEMSERRK